MSHLGEKHPMRPEEPKGRLYCTYAEAVMLLHKMHTEETGSLPSPLIQASIVAAIYGRETLTVFEDLKRGMVP